MKGRANKSRNNDDAHTLSWVTFTGRSAVSHADSEGNADVFRTFSNTEDSIHGQEKGSSNALVGSAGLGGGGRHHHRRRRSSWCVGWRETTRLHRNRHHPRPLVAFSGRAYLWSRLHQCLHGGTSVCPSVRPSVHALSSS